MADKNKKPKKEIVEFGELELSDSDGTIDEGERFTDICQRIYRK